VYHWSCAKIREADAMVSDEALLEKLRTRLTMGSSAAAKPCVAEIAAEAHRVGRQRLATMLLEQVRR
jgi:hypothetical protein